MLHNLQRLEPASAGLLALNGKVAGRYNMLFEAIRQTGTIGNFNPLAKNAGMDIPTLLRRVIQEMIQCNYTNEIRGYDLEAKLTELIPVLAGELTD